MALTAVALGIRGVFGSHLAAVPYLPAYFAVLAASRYLGLGPSILVTMLGAAGCTIIPPAAHWARLPLFLVLSALLIWIVEGSRRSRAEAERHARVANDRLAQLEVEMAHRAQQERLSAQFRAIVESSQDAIVSIDLEGEILSWNRGAEHVFGYKATEAVGRALAFLLPPDRVPEEMELRQRIRSGARVNHFETVRLHKDGRQIHVSLTVSAIRGPDGAIMGISNIARDITDRKEFEEQIRQTQKLESLGVLAGGLAHDFNNLLTGIMGNASLAIVEMDHPPKACARLEEVLQASERAALLIRQMLAYAGKGRFLVERLNLSAHVREILPLLRTSIPRLIDVELRLDDHLPSVEADRSQIQQLVMNLAINAAEAIGDATGTVVISTTQRAIDSEGQVILEVSDTGCGMTAEVKDRIFDPFYTTKFTGRGLGLAAVMGIIRGHRGTVSVASAPGKGTTMTVVLPAVLGEIPVKNTEIDVELRGFGLILVADDEELVRKMAKFTLERYGYSIETACDGRDALEQFRSKPDDFAAVLLDLTMPQMQGEEVLRHIRKIRSDVPVVLSSGYTEAEAVHQFDDLGLSGFLQKPYSATGLARKIKAAIASS